MEERLQKILSAHGVSSRRAAEGYLSARAGDGKRMYRAGGGQGRPGAGRHPSGRAASAAARPAVLI